MKSKIRVAIAGVGNSTSALIQGIEYYKDFMKKNSSKDVVPGLAHPTIGNYTLDDIEFVAAFDINKRKIGKDLAEAIFEPPNCVTRFSNVRRLGAEVHPGPILDGVDKHTEEAFLPYGKEIKPVDVSKVLELSNADLLINYLPVGSSNATRFYANEALSAGCAFINAIPEFVASDESWGEKFKKANLPLAGDDVKSQLGATILHRRIVELFVRRGVAIDETYQLNIGGDTDFLNMTKEDRLKTKRVSKTNAVLSLIPYEVPTRIGPSDYVSFLRNTKIAYIYIKGRNFGERPVVVELKLSVEDSPNSAGVMIDVIRAVKIALDKGISGPLISVSAYAFKHPPVNVSDDMALDWFNKFISGERDI
ncbi:MAG: inositol-3-phosphate synthase [Thermoproteota archaeon]